MEHCVLLIDTPIGPLTLESDGQAVTALRFGVRGETSPLPCPVLAAAARELAEYFAGQRRDFTVPLSRRELIFRKRSGTPFSPSPTGRPPPTARSPSGWAIPGPAGLWAWPIMSIPCPYSSPATGWWAAAEVSPATPEGWKRNASY